MKRILITGGAGFIGSHLSERLLDEGNAVICLDNMMTGAKDNIAHLKDRKDFSFIQHDVTEPYHVEADEIYNLACPASPIHYQRDPLHTTRTCVLGAINALELAKKLNIRVLQTSTSEVYGDPDVHPQHESYWGNVNPIGPRSCYDEGKRCAETIFFNYHHQFGVKTKVVRIFNTYGPRMHENDGRVVSNFIVQALNGKDISIYGDGSQTRSFCFVDDLVDGLIKTMATDDDFVGPVNLGNPDERSVLMLAEAVLAMTESASKVVTHPLPGDDPRRRRPDIELARTRLGWQPQIALEEGLARTVAYFATRILSQRINASDGIAPDAQTMIAARSA